MDFQKRHKTKREVFLETMDAMIPWEEWVHFVLLEYPARVKRRRRLKTVETLLRMLLLQTWFHLPDKVIEDIISDSYSMRRFLRLDFPVEIPSAEELRRFRKRLISSGLWREMLDSIQNCLERNGKTMRGGTIVDAAVTDAAPHPETKRRVSETSPANGPDWYSGQRCHIDWDHETKTARPQATASRAPEEETAPERQKSRTEYVTKNIFWGYIGNIASMILSFVSRTAFIYIIGITYLGVNGLFTNVLGVLSFSELGIGTAMNFSLYKPVAEQDTEKIKSLMCLYKNAYRVIAGIITGLGLALLPFLPYIIKGGEGIEHIPLYYLIFLFNTVSSYFVTYKYGLIYAEQKGYLLTNIDSVCRFFIVLLQIIALFLFRNFLVYLLAQAIAQLIQKIFTAVYINKMYPYLSDKNVQKLDKEEKQSIKTNVKALIVHKLGEISVYQTDNIIISAFISVTLVGLVSNYTMLLTTVSGFLTIVFNSFTAGFGNLIATESKETQKKLFNVYHFLGFWLYGFTTICFIVLIQPFITLWLGSDKLIDTLSMMLIMVNQYFVGQRTTLNNFKTAGGVFNPDKFISILQSVINLGVSITLVYFIGLPGVYIGTVVQGLTSNIWRPVIVYRTMFQESAAGYFKDFTKYLLTTAGAAAIMLLISSAVLGTLTLLRFALMALLTAVIPNALFFVLFRKNESFLFLSAKIKSLRKGWIAHAG